MELEDLPEHRREAMLWRHALELDYDGVADLVRSAERRWCLSGLDVEPGPDPVLKAVLGDDGLHHLRVDDRHICAQVRRRADPSDVLRHACTYYWWADSAGRIVSGPKGSSPDGLRGGRVRSRVSTVRWVVRLTDTVTEPELVPYLLRCYKHYDWPPLRTTRNGLSRVRGLLIAEFGDRCQTCGRRGEVVDHDHFTGLVRGWLCKFCNHIVDDCPHPAGCPFAEYLNNPPATWLRLRHPKAGHDYRKSGSLARIELLGFDPFVRPTRPTRRQAP
ncbi:endonuclease domain-containing protein [Saccharothrix saharensis]|uniref:endonuclease domain-containing protein n=1 Tax=Saccharothrix saharensis TaxID=571190 RepID=UPI0036978F86